MVIALHWLSVAVLWWLGVACSPLAGRAVDAGVYYPLATAIAALATAQLVRRYTHAESWHELGLAGRSPLRAVGPHALDSRRVCWRSWPSCSRRERCEPATVLTLDPGLADAGPGGAGERLGRRPPSRAAWPGRRRGAWPGLVVAPRLGWTAGRAAGDLRRGRCAVGGVLALGAGRLAAARRVDPEESDRTGFRLESQRLRSRLARAVEIAAFASSLLAAVAVLMAGTNPPAVPGWETAAGVGVLMGAALLHILLVPRWQAEWLVYLAQAIMLGAYVDYRMAFPRPIAFDAIDPDRSGLSRPGHRRGSRAAPARGSMSAPPAISRSCCRSSRSFSSSGAGDSMTSACSTCWPRRPSTAVACGQIALEVAGLRGGRASTTRPSGCSGAGWAGSSPDHPQFFLVPVGLSTILFAEVNRRDLGRSNGQHDPLGRPHDHLRVAGRADLAIRELRRLGNALDLLAGGHLPGDRHAAPDVSLDGAGDLRARRDLRDGARRAWTTRSPSGRSCSLWASRWCSSWLSTRRSGSSPRCGSTTTRPGCGSEAS